MPTPTMPFAVRLSPELFEALDAKARAYGVSRTELVRRMVAALAVPDISPERDAA
jgi:hypothetical protein